MHEYRRVGPTFWSGRTGKALKAKGSEAVIVALYLMTCQHSNMLGMYFVPRDYIAADTGLGIEGASKGLQWAIEAGFCRYDDDTEVVWVVEMAAYQIGDRLDAKDLRCKGIQREYNSLQDNPFLPMFFERYGAAFHMTECRPSGEPLQSPFKAPPKPGTGTGAETEEGAGPVTAPANPPADPPTDPPPAPPAAVAASTRGTRLGEDWQLPRSWGDWALAEFPGWTADKVRVQADSFRDFWVAKTGKDATKLDWQATWRNWCRSPIAQRAAATGSAGKSFREQDADQAARRVAEATGGLLGAKASPTTTQEVFDVEDAAIRLG